ncbi:MAG: lytic murein transglycosylase [Fidelibacterota bacterium]
MHPTIFILLTVLLINNSYALTKDSVYHVIKERAMKKGVSEEYLQRALDNENIQIHKEILERFAKPYESKSWEEYKKLFVKPSRINKGSEFYKEQQNTLVKVSKSYGVDLFLILSIVGIESNYGSHHKQFTVFNSLYTQISEMPKRANWATTELIEFLYYCYQDSIPPHSIYGSYAGAFGYGQFIPSSFNRFAVDFDGDGVRQAYEWPDVMASIANYLVKNGYPSNDYENQEKVYKAVYSYNHSDNYVKAVLALRNELRDSIKSKGH